MEESLPLAALSQPRQQLGNGRVLDNQDESVSRERQLVNLIRRPAPDEAAEGVSVRHGAAVDRCDGVAAISRQCLGQISGQPACSYENDVHII